MDNAHELAAQFFRLFDHFTPPYMPANSCNQEHFFEIHTFQIGQIPKNWNVVNQFSSVFASTIINIPDWQDSIIRMRVNNIDSIASTSLANPPPPSIIIFFISPLNFQRRKYTILEVTCNLVATIPHGFFSKREHYRFCTFPLQL